MLDCLARYLIGPAADFAQHLTTAVDSFPPVGRPMTRAKFDGGKFHEGMTEPCNVGPFFNHADGHSWLGSRAASSV